MPLYARIENGRIAEIAAFDRIEGRFAPSLIWEDITGVDGATVGKVLDPVTRAVSDPPPDGPPHIALSKLAFRRLFTLEERTGIDDFASSTTLTDAQKATVRTLQYDLSIAEEVVLDDPLTIAGVMMLEQFGLIGAGRANQILTNTTPPQA